LLIGSLVFAGIITTLNVTLNSPINNLQSASLNYNFSSNSSSNISLSSSKLYIWNYYGQLLTATGLYSNINFSVTGSLLYAITYYNNSFYILDNNKSVYRYNINGTFISSFIINNGATYSPSGITYYNGYLWISDNSVDNVYQYSMDGIYTNINFPISTIGNYDSQSLAYGNDSFWLTDGNSYGTVFQINATNYNLINSFSLNGISALDPSVMYFADKLWISVLDSDSLYHHVYEYYTNGTLIGEVYTTSESLNGFLSMTNYDNNFWMLGQIGKRVYKYYSFMQPKSGLINQSSWNYTINSLGNYEWNVQSCDISGTCKFSVSNYNLDISDGFPNTYLYSPTNVSFSNNLTQNFIV